MKKKSTARKPAAVKKTVVTRKNKATPQKPRRQLREENIPAMPKNLRYRVNTPFDSTIEWDHLNFTQIYEVGLVVYKTGKPQEWNIEKIGETTSEFFRIPPELLNAGAAQISVRGINCEGKGIGPWADPAFTVERPKPTPIPSTAALPPQATEPAPTPPATTATSTTTVAPTPVTTVTAAQPAAETERRIDEQPPQQKTDRPGMHWIQWLIIILLASSIIILAMVLQRRPDVQHWISEIFSKSVSAGTVCATDPNRASSVPPVQCVVTQIVEVPMTTAVGEARSICIDNHDGGTLNIDARGANVTVHDSDREMHMAPRNQRESANDIGITREWQLKNISGQDSSLFIGKQFITEDTVYPNEIVRYTAEPGWQVTPWTQEPNDIDVQCGTTDLVSTPNPTTTTINSGQRQVQIVVRSKTDHTVRMRFKLVYLGNQ